MSATRPKATNRGGNTTPSGGRTPSRRELLALAAVLAATVLTAAAAVAGLTRTAPPAQRTTPTVSQIIGPAPAAAPRVEPGD